MEYNITYRKKDKGWQYIINVKKDRKWKYAGSKQGFKTKSLAVPVAEKHLERLKEKAAVQAEALPEHKNLTFEQLADIYKKHKTLHQSINTVKGFESAYTHFTILNEKELISITSLDIQYCIDGMTESGLTLSTIKLYTNIMKTFFHFAITPYKLIKTNPVKDVRMPQKDKVKKEKIKALTKKELDTLLEKITYPKHHLIALIAGKCGLRAGEIAGLTWDRIDFKSMQVTIDRQWKELKKGKWGFGSTKSDNSNRIVPMPAVVASELLKYKAMHPTHISGRVIPVPTAGAIVNSMLYCFKRLNYDISIHDLRHTYATTLIANGLDFKTVAKLMGHDVNETIKTYSHVTSDMMKNAANLINKVF